MIHTKNQYKELAKILKVLKSHNAYFKDYISENIETEYEKMPIIYKQDILNHCEDYISDLFSNDYQEYTPLAEYLVEVRELSHNHDRIYNGKSGKQWILETTTGSTGKPFTILKDTTEKFVESLTLFNMRKQHYKIATPQNGFMLLQPVDEYIKSISYRGISDENMPLIIQYMTERKPEWLLITTLLLRRMYKCIIEHHFEENIKNLRLKFIETTSQALTIEEKKSISELFQCPIVNQFGCREVWNIAYECPCGKMHINNRYLIVDLVDDEGNIIKEHNKEGAIVITSLLHKNFPFIKYYLGDYAYFSNEVCECGNKAPIIVFAGGRKKDKLIGSEYYGTEIFRKLMRFIYFKHLDLEVEDIFITQNDINILNIQVIININKRKEFQSLFQQTFNFLIGNNDYDLRFLYVDKIDNQKNISKPEIFENFYAK